MKLDILAIGAHPDDVELGCGATLAKEVSNGKKVGIIDLTRGELGTRGTAETRDEESQEAAKILGIAMRTNMEFADGFFVNNKQHQIELIKQIRKYKPEIVLANSVSDRHPDHGRASSLVSRSAYLSGLAKIETKGMEAWRPKSVYHYIQDYYIKPDFVVDISDHMNTKIKAIQAFKTQFFDPMSTEPETPISGEDFFEFIRARGKEFGRQAGYKYAEGFTTERFLGVQDIMTLD